MTENWEKLADEKMAESTAKAIKERGIEVFVVNNGKEALEKIKGMIPGGAEVMNGTSATLTEIGFMDYLNSGKHPWKNMQDKVAAENDPQKRADIRRAASAAEYFLGSVNAISENGELVSVDASGSRVSAYPFAAKNVILVAGTNKIAKNLEEAIKRVKKHVFPLENERAKKVYGSGSTLGKWVIIEREFQKGRIRLILVKEKLGF